MPPTSIHLTPNRERETPFPFCQQPSPPFICKKRKQEQNIFSKYIHNTASKLKENLCFFNFVKQTGLNTKYKQRQKQQQIYHHHQQQQQHVQQQLLLLLPPGNTHHFPPFVKRGRKRKIEDVTHNGLLVSRTEDIQGGPHKRKQAFCFICLFTIVVKKTNYNLNLLCNW